MTLQQQRCMFAYYLVNLINEINSTDGFSCNLGDVMATTGHCKNSYHYRGLAADINLFFHDVYCKRTEQHAQFGEYWKSLHPYCTWGGDFKKKDGNHYSFGEGKVVE